jgi:hypothetical protein
VRGCKKEYLPLDTLILTFSLGEKEPVLALELEAHWPLSSIVDQ